MAEVVRFDESGQLVEDTLDARTSLERYAEEAAAVAKVPDGIPRDKWLRAGEIFDNCETDCCKRAEAYSEAYELLTGASVDVSDCCSRKQAFDDLRYLVTKVLA